jgi:hypothetical protein
LTKFPSKKIVDSALKKAKRKFYDTQIIQSTISKINQIQSFIHLFI